MKKFIKILLASCCFIMATIVVNAENNQSMTVTYTGVDNYIVDIPAELVLTTNPEGKQEGTYTVKVSGDFVGTVKVAPTSTTITMKEINGRKNDVIADVVQTKDTWTLNDVSTNATGTITTQSNLGAGNWSGVLNFNITKQ